MDGGCTASTHWQRKTLPVGWLWISMLHDLPPSSASATTTAFRLLTIIASSGVRCHFADTVP